MKSEIYKGTHVDFIVSLYDNFYRPYNPKLLSLVYTLKTTNSFEKIPTILKVIKVLFFRTTQILTSSTQSRGSQGTQSTVYNRCSQVGGRICRTAKIIFRVCNFSPTSNQDSPAGACIWTQ